MQAFAWQAAGTFGIRLGPTCPTLTADHVLCDRLPADKGSQGIHLLVAHGYTVDIYSGYHIVVISSWRSMRCSGLTSNSMHNLSYIVSLRDYLRDRNSSLTHIFYKDGEYWCLYSYTNTTSMPIFSILHPSALCS